MTTLTPYYELVLYNATTDNVALFSEYRAAVDGVSNSNMIKIDNTLASLQSQVLNISGSSSLIPIIDGGGGVFSATGVTFITTYVTGQAITVIPDAANSGATTLEINSLGSRNMSKVDASGTIVDLDSGDLVAGKMYYFVYDGTYWILLGYFTKRDQAEMIESSTDKTTPVNADLFGIYDSVSGLLNKLSFSNLKAVLKSYFDTLYAIYVSPGTAGNVLTSSGTTWTSAPPASTGHTIEDEGTPLTQRTKLNFVGTNVAVTDDLANDATVVTLSSGGGHTIEDEGAPLTQRTKLNFVGAGVAVTDDSGNDATTVTISSSGGGLTSVTTDATLTGDGTALSPLSVVGGASGGVSGTGLITILPPTYTGINGSWSSENSSGFFSKYYNNSSASVGDYLEYQTYLEGGTYSFMLNSPKNADGGIYTISVDGVDIGTFDLYNPSLTWNNETTLAGVVLSTSGIKTIRMRISGKNPSGTAYNGYWHWMSIFMTTPGTGGGGGGGGAVAHTFVGKDTAGDADETFSVGYAYIKKITLTMDGLLSNVGIYMKGDASHVGNFSGVVYADSAGSPGKMLLGPPSIGGYSLFLNASYGWLSFPAGLWLAAGDYWVGVYAYSAANFYKMSKVDGGIDRIVNVGSGWVPDADLYGSSSASADYSIRASFISGVSGGASSSPASSVYLYSTFK